MSQRDHSRAGDRHHGIEHSIFIGGCPRSGTTLLGSILGGAEGAIATPESQFKNDIRSALAKNDMPKTAAAITNAIAAHWRFRLWKCPVPMPEQLEAATIEEATLAAVAAYAVSRGRVGTRRWVDHTPDNIRQVPWLLSSFPDARIVHIVRDGRGVAASLMRMDVGPETVRAAAKLWVQSVGIGLAVESAFPTKVKRVMYESILHRPAETVEELCRFLECGYSAGMLGGGGFEVPRYSQGSHRLVGSHPDPAAADKWRQTLSDREVELFEWVAGPMLRALQYPVLHEGIVRGPTTFERLGDLYKDLIWGPLQSAVKNRSRRRQAVL